MPKKRRSWGTIATLVILGNLFLDLTVYFEFSWWTFPLVVIGNAMAGGALVHKLMGVRLDWSAVGAGVLTGIPLFLWVKLWADPEYLHTWEEMETPLKWILP